MVEEARELLLDAAREMITSYRIDGRDRRSPATMRSDLAA
jgi:hypothetical protein